MGGGCGDGGGMSKKVRAGMSMERYALQDFYEVAFTAISIAKCFPTKWQLIIQSCI
jgi:hypothetical protein